MKAWIAWIALFLCGFVQLPISVGRVFLSSSLRMRGGESVDDYDVGRPHDFIVGKDRELLHASVDLKWLFDKISDRSTWLNAIESVVHRIRRLHPGYEAEHQYRLGAVKIVEDIRVIDPSSFVLRVFQFSIHEAQQLSLLKEKPIAIYCEDALPEDVMPSLSTFMFRKSLCDTELGSFLNSQFIFLASYRHHSYLKELLTSIGDQRAPELMKPPFLLILRPRPREGKAASSSSVDMELLAVFSIEDKAAVKDHSPAIFSFLEEALTKHHQIQWKTMEEGEKPSSLPASSTTKEDVEVTSQSPSTGPPN